ncbi:MAG: hypothetical protein V1728_00195 [Candidatus Micrarchaeota archaeon]
MLTISIGIGLAIAASLVAIFYMLGQYFSIEGLKAYSRVETGELVLSVIVAAVVLAAFSSQFQLLQAVSGDSTMSSAKVAGLMQTYMEQPLASMVKVLSQDAFRFTKVASYNYNYQAPSFLPFNPTSSNSPGSGAYPIITQLTTAVDTSSMTLLLAQAARLAYLFMDYSFALLIMPIGFVLRFIPPTRKVGGLLLGIGLSVHLVFPAAVVMTAGLATSFAPSLDPDGSHPKSWLNDGGQAADGKGLLLADPGTPPDSNVIASPVANTMYQAGEIIGPKGVCTVGCAAVCAPLLVTGGFLACWNGCMGEAPPQAPYWPGWACQGIYGMVQWLMQVIYPIYGSVSVENSFLHKTPEEIASQYFDPLLHVVLPVAIERNLAVLIMLVIDLAASIVLARGFATVIGGEGQFYGLNKLI